MLWIKHKDFGKRLDIWGDQIFAEGSTGFCIFNRQFGNIKFFKRFKAADRQAIIDDARKRAKYLIGPMQSLQDDITLLEFLHVKTDYSLLYNVCHETAKPFLDAKQIPYEADDQPEPPKLGLVRSYQFFTDELSSVTVYASEAEYAAIQSYLQARGETDRQISWDTRRYLCNEYQANSVI